MDFEEKSLAEFAENDLRELLDSNYYVEALRAANDMDFTSLIDNSLGSGIGVVLNDRLIAEASLGVISQAMIPALIPVSFNESAPIKTEHSYSLSSQITNSTEDDLSDLESECFPAIPITEAEGSRTSNPLFCQESSAERLDEESEDFSSAEGKLERHASTETLSCCGDCCRPEEDLQLEETSPFNLQDLDDVSDEEMEQLDNCLAINTVERLLPPKNTSSNPTITVISMSNNSSTATKNSPTFTIAHSHSDNLQGDSEKHKISDNSIILLSKEDRDKFKNASVTIRQNSVRTDSAFSFPPTPPSCSSSDSESGGDQSPSRLCPLYETLSPNFWNPKKAGSLRNSSRTPITTSLISTQPRGATGTLNLTEEEKRTLLSEGYPIPSRLPLTKAEEKSLKKIRRKIKNKISAQESRRKKKEYMDTLEQKVDVLEQQNRDYKRRVDSLQRKNNQMLEELHKLQSLVQKDERNRLRSTGKATIMS